jgi:hypothetical protein
MNEKAGALKNGQLLITLVISVIGAIGGAGGGSYIYFSRLAPSQLEAIARQDKFTGTEGAAIIRRLAALLRQELAFLRASLDKLEKVVDAKEDKQ